MPNPVRAVLFDVDFTLIYPGPTLRGEGYQAFCAKYGIDVDTAQFTDAVAAAAPLLDCPDDVYDSEIFVKYTARIIEGMGGTSDRVTECAREVYTEWAANHHFELYEEVPAVLRDLAAAGKRIGLISNSHRCLASFQTHFELQGLISGAISSSEHGFMKPHRSIFTAALALLGTEPAETLMVGDSLKQDVDGALAAGMQAVYLHRGHGPFAGSMDLAARGVSMITSLDELRPLLLG